MRFFSFFKDGFTFIPAEIQVSLLPGLPDVKFTGLVDLAIKESALRLKSAFKKQGFYWPVKQQMIINVSPSYIKKSSSGMDLALASAILWKTGQMDFSHYNQKALYFYGEIDLNGQVRTPSDWKYLPLGDKTLIIGDLQCENYKQNLYSLLDLKDLMAPQLIPMKDWKQQLKTPELPDISFSKKAGEILKVAATGEHSLLLCGEAGSGKTTLAEHLYYLLSPPNKKAFEQLEQMTNKAQKWRAFISPHHSATPLSIIGGGSPLFLGEISKAHGGLLLLDEYLEFHPKVQEALREPLEKGEIRLVRRGQTATFPSRFLLTATSNLCPCGDYEPNKPTQCSYSLRRCGSYLDRLSGPMLDRFDVLAFSKDWKGEQSVSLKDLKQEVQQAQDFSRKTRQQDKANGYLDLKQLEAMLKEDLKPLLPHSSSFRRKRALLRVARTFSDLKQEVDISPHSIEQALGFSIKNFFFLKNRVLHT